MDPNDLTGRELAGYRLTQRIGSGGMATVYRAENLLQPSIVRALKVVHPNLAAQKNFIRRFAEEAHNLELLTHSNIVRFHGLRHEAGYHIMELELLSGKTLTEVMDASPSALPLADVVRWIREGAEGVAAAHALEIVHRDLKPENLFLTDDGVVKVLDFGIARARDEAERATRLTQAGTVPGTAGYLAPEGWDSGMCNPEADVYALGITLAELLLGHHPFMPPDAPRPSAMQLMNAHVNRGLPDLRGLRSDVPPWLAGVVAKATARDPAARYSTAAELAHALEQAETVASESGDPVGGTASYTELALPTIQRPTKTLTVPEEQPAAATEGGGRRWGLMGGGAVVVLGAVGAGLWFTSGDEPAELVPVNAWVAIAAPERPLALGLPGEQGVGFWPAAEVRAPSVSYAIQQHEVTWAELEPWLAANTSYDFDRPPGLPAERGDLAASGVPWATADAYCQSLGDGVWLPTEEQWEYAARGEALRPYAWGDRAPDPLRTNAFQGEDWAVRAVMQSSQDHTPGGDAALYDLMGNVREWTADPFRVSNSGVTPPQAASADQTMRVIRGLPLKPHPNGDVFERPMVGAAWRTPLCGTGSCLSEPTLEGEPLADALREVGFRCARETGL